MASPDQLKHVLSETLSPDANVRRNGKEYAIPGAALILLVAS